jgi:predicted phage tail protein
MRKFALLLATLAAAALVAPAAFATGPTCVQGTAGVAPTATLTFTPPTTYTDGTPISGAITYEIFEGAASGQETLAAKGLAGSPITVHTGLKDGTTAYFYLETVAADGNASAPSNEVCKSFPAGIPSAVTIRIT